MRDGAFGLDDLHAVTRRAELRLRGFDQLALDRLRTVHAVAGGAGQLPELVRASLPARVITTVVARRHVALMSAGFIARNFAMWPLASSSTCAWPGPWQLSQPRPAAGERGFFA